MNTDGEPRLTTNQLVQRWGVTRQRVWQRANKHPGLLRPIRDSPNVTLWRLADVERYEREILRPGGART